MPYPQRSARSRHRARNTRYGEAQEVYSRISCRRERRGRGGDMPEVSDLITQEDLQRFKDAVRKEATDRAAKWTVGAVVALLGFAAVGWWFYLQPKIVNVVGGVPSGAVAAFDREGCPDGWSPFVDAAGRVILGVGQGEGLSRRRYREMSSPVESVRLTESHIPAHQHETLVGLVEVGAFGNGPSRRAVIGRDMGPVAATALSSSYGRNPPEAFSIMPPFVALQFCKKA